MVVLKKRGARCECCGATPANGAVMNVDHVHPRKTHPQLALEETNLQVLCGDCNHGKGNWDSTDWRAREGYFFNENSRRKLAHIWTGADTACRMWSAGSIGTRKGGWGVFQSSQGKSICNQCTQVLRRQNDSNR